MVFESLPIIQVRLDFLSQKISHHLGIEGSELSEAIEKEIRKQFKESVVYLEEEISEKIKTFINDRINYLLKDFFEYGEGSIYLDKVITDSFNQIIKNKKDKSKKEI